MARTTRNAKGHFVQGGKLSAAHRKAISKGQIERHKRNRAQQGPRPDSKRCTKCGKRKRVPEDFPMRKRKLASGEVTEYPAGECKVCARQRAAAWLESLGPEEAKRRMARYNRKRVEKDREEYRRKHREWARAARERAGAKPRGPWKRYRVQPAPDYVGAAPFLEWWDLFPARRRPSLSESESRLVRRARQTLREKGKARVDRRVVDEIMTRAGVPDQVHALYHDDEDT